MPMSTANHSRVSHAPFSLRQSCQVMTPVTSCRDMPSIAATTEDMPILSPKIHKITVRPIVAHTIVSSCDRGPSFLSFSAASTGASGVSWISGGNILNTRRGVTRRPTRWGTHDALNHVSHGAAADDAEARRELEAEAVLAPRLLHMAEEWPLHCSWVWMRNAPSLRDAGTGCGAGVLGQGLDDGEVHAPARAVVEGMAAARGSPRRWRP